MSQVYLWHTVVSFYKSRHQATKMHFWFNSICFHDRATTLWMIQYDFCMQITDSFKTIGTDTFLLVKIFYADRWEFERPCGLSFYWNQYIFALVHFYIIWHLLILHFCILHGYTDSQPCDDSYFWIWYIFLCVALCKIVWCGPWHFSSLKVKENFLIKEIQFESASNNKHMFVKISCAEQFVKHNTSKTYVAT